MNINQDCSIEAQHLERAAKADGFGQSIAPTHHARRPPKFKSRTKVRLLPGTHTRTLKLDPMSPEFQALWAR